MNLIQIPIRNLLLTLITLIFCLTLFTISSNSQSCNEMNIPICTDTQIENDCSGCKSADQQYCCTDTMGCNTDLTTICNPPCNENNICQMPDECTDSGIPNCSGSELTDCSACGDNTYCCPMSGETPACNTSFTDLCNGNTCTDSNICFLPCTAPETVPTCDSGDTMCSGCEENEFCCPATGTCNSSFNTVCDSSSCTSSQICVVPVLEREFTFINKCSETIWVGAFTNQFKGGFELTGSCSMDSDCVNGCPPISGISDCSASCVSGNCEVMFTGNIDTGVADSISGRVWPMTGCDFDGNLVCAGGTGNAGGPRCCDTGSCTIEPGGFGLQCNSSGDPPNTVAEFTLTSGANNDFYDVSLIDGYNIPIEMKPTGTSADAPNEFDTSYWCGNPGGVSSATDSSLDCAWDTEFGTHCNGNPDFRTVGSLQTCTDDSECGSGNCNVSSGVCECKEDTDCSTGDICGVPDPGFTGFKACGTLTGCTTAKDICGLYFGQGVSGDACGQEKLCASGVCETSTPMSCTTSAECNSNSQCKMDFCDNDPSKTCTMDSECGAGNTCITVKSCTNNTDKTCTDDVNCNVAVCSGGECQCIPNLCVGPSGSKTCTNDGLSCNDSPCTQTCDGICTEGPADFLDCNELVQTNKQVACSADTDCPALVGLPACTMDSDCPENTTCVDFGAAPAPGQPAIAKVCRLTCDTHTNFCSGPTCTDNSDCTTMSLSGTFMQCDTSTNTCVATNTSLYEGAGLTGQSCYINYYGGFAPSLSCNGCPTACDDPPCSPAQAANANWPSPPSGESCKNTNTDWVSVAEPLVEGFKEACPSAYSFPFDDPTSTFQCTNNTQSNSMSYEVTFCSTPPFPPPPPPPPTPVIEDETVEDPIKINPGDNGPFVSIEFDPDLDGGGQILVGLPPGVLAEFAQLNPVVGDCEIVSQTARVTDPDVICRVEDFPENLDMLIEFCREADQQGVVQAAVEVLSDGMPEEEFSNFLDILLDELDLCASKDDDAGDDGSSDITTGDDTGTGGCSLTPAGSESKEVFLFLLIPGLIIVSRLLRKVK